MDFDVFEFDETAFAISFLIWLIFLVMVVKVPTWAEMKLVYKIIMLAVGLPLFYIVALLMVNKD